ncbi:amidohydrolase family protein [Acuticoccus sp. M5D2P5]|uniref:amidohydrolase family protein n=1 Tax=Acuticoccus kalidii TaxID=2910977 RepID=UPI001F1C8934|nr:amidohydrolase family protein [Acuticoccus kalidii]MCF3936105.1 amidohydrolase family protein [Acuticoccus kalidii]
MVSDSAPKLVAPKNTCDTHMHVYGKEYPLAPTALGPAPDATVDDYRLLQKRLGTTRTVIVQPSAYGKDNRCTVDGIAALGLETTRGIAVVDDQVTLDELRTLTDQGMRGARFHMLPGGAIPWEMLDTIAARVQEVGWHVQLQLDGRLLPEKKAQILSWPGTIVIDHVGKYLEPVGVDHPAFKTLLDLVDTGRVWVKLSAPYEVSRTGPPYSDVGTLAKALAKAAPERMLWASNWPHPSVTDKPDDALLLDLMLDWVEDDKTRERILVDNAAEVYGF